MVTKASVGGKVTAHFSLNAPVWGLHLITRCFKQMAREGRAGSWLLLRGYGRTNPESRSGVPGCPAQPPLQEPLQDGALSLQFRGAFQIFTNQPRVRSSDKERTRPAASFCPLNVVGFLLWMVFWNRPGCICYPIQKVSINVIHLQINFSASDWVSNKKGASLWCPEQTHLQPWVAAFADLGPVSGES